MAGVAGVQLEVPDHLQVQLDTGSMLCSLALVQTRGHRALARRGQQHGRVVTGGAPFFECSREVCLGVGLARTLVQSQGPRALFLEQSLLLEGKKVKGERPKTDEPGKPRVPPTPPHCSRKRVPGPSSPLTSSQGRSLTPHPTVGDQGVGVQGGTITEVRGKQGKEATATTRAAKWSSRSATGVHCSAL